MDLHTSHIYRRARLL
ncbi:hypothetical protein HPG69_010877 [Diceros bicornis minor]|uniref:Uncharacterized protein n=1 Tax=Diceros bicornis minor TaxID=77932 RepID=A0A7J7EGL3_DICBM|nr:hypothetical protein HPG69_010877 [Diceros bicornis minor]